MTAVKHPMPSTAHPLDSRQSLPKMRPIKTVEEFYAHALAIEREAAERYA